MPIKKEIWCKEQEEVVSSALKSLIKEIELGEVHIVKISKYFNQIYSIGFFHGSKEERRARHVNNTRAIIKIKNNRIQHYSSITQAANSNGVSRVALSEALKKGKMCKGAMYKYVDKK